MRRLLSGPGGPSTEFRAVPRVPRRDFRTSFRKGEPRVVLDNVPGWPALHRWNPAYLRSVAGDREVTVRETDGPPRNIFQNLATGGRTSFGQYLDWVLDTAGGLEEITLSCTGAGEITRAVCADGFRSSYYLDANLPQLSEALLDDAPPPAWYRHDPLDANLWCGVLGTSSGLHCDVTPNCNVQVVGRKHFVLFPPSQARRVYRIPQITHCRFDPNLPDYERFPRARHATGWQCTLKPGESLYIPVGWYHQVTVVSAWALNVNFFWPRPLAQGLSAPPLWPFLLRRRWARLRGRS
ncbi:cupin-like domain-containing protein [Streptomyces sp. NPDC057027]|uniref:cupin-like domain-containing protein n=1 Tax=Streptomyces sp. NPDC057027 TaxID=3346004 RepID=UPI00362900ED